MKNDKRTDIIILLLALLLIAVVSVGVIVCLKINVANKSSKAEIEVEEDTTAELVPIEIETTPSTEPINIESFREIIGDAVDAEVEEVTVVEASEEEDIPSDVQSVLPELYDYVYDCTDFITEFKEVTLSHKYVGIEDNNYVVEVTVDNTEIGCVFRIDKDTLEIQPSDCTLKYGPDFAVIWFDNGIPENSMAIYDAIYAAEMYSTMYETDYTGGSTVSLTDLDTGEVYTLELE